MENDAPAAAGASAAAKQPAGPDSQGAPPEGAPPSGDPPTSAVGDTPGTSTAIDEEAESQSQDPGRGEWGALDAPSDQGQDMDESELDESALEVDADFERLVEDLERLQGEREELLDQLLRARADFDNYRKRMVRQQTELAERAAEELVGKLLEVLDVFDAARLHGQGFEQVCALLAGALEKEGLTRVSPVGAAFDPTESDAVAHEPGDGEAQPTVSQVLRAGYRWKGRVLRPAMVKVKG